MTTLTPTREDAPGPPPSLGPVELARWGWRRLTSMRTALVLLFLLALAAVPGSVYPQEGIDPVKVAQYKDAHRTLGPVYDRLGLFHVFSAPWFAAIYLLLFVSLAGCVLPRGRQHWSAMRARPPRAPRNLDRLPAYVARPLTGGDASAVLDASVAALRQRRYRVDVHADAVAAERGYLRESGNLLFHVSLVALLVAVAIGNLFGYKGSVLVVEGGEMANSLSVYDSFSHGAAFDEARMPPFTLKLQSMQVRYQRTGDQRGAPRGFDARLRYTTTLDGATEAYDLRVNHPLVIGGTKVFLIGNGYAPVFTVRDATSENVYSAPVPFLPRDSNNTSDGVIKVPGAQPVQLGFQALFLPTAAIDRVRGPVSTYPGLVDPRVVLNAWTGDLGVDSGTPQSVYRLDTRKMTQVEVDGKPLAQALSVGDTMTLPDGQGSIRFDGVRRYATLQVAHDPGKTPALFSALAALAGLLLSLFVRRRRIWVRVRVDAAGVTLVEVAGLARVEGEDRDGLREEVGEIADASVLPGTGKTVVA